MTAARPVLVSAGLLLIAVAVRMLIRRRHAAGAVDGRDPPLARVAGGVLWHAARLARKLGWFHPPPDETKLCTRLAVAPECWPARCIAVAHRAATARPRAGATGDSDGAGHVDLAEVMRGVRLCSAVAFGLAGAFCWPLLGPVAAAMLAALCAPAGAFLPDIALAAAARRATRSLALEDATAIDVLAAATAAGLGLVDALQLAATHAPPAAAAALRAGALRLATGADPRSALAGEAARFGVAALADAGEAVDRQRRVGAPLGAELRAIATRQRAAQRARIVERAARRAPLGTLVIALVVAPVCLAALIACLVGGLVESGGLPLR